MALAQTMSGITSPHEVTTVLARYQRQRFGPAVAHVSRSERAAAVYLPRPAGDRRSSRGTT